MAKRGMADKSMSEHQAKFEVGQIIQHRLFDYLGVIFDVDPVFSGTDEWYEAVAKSRPPKDQPWYHVLVHESAQTTYVAERNLEACEEPQRIVHPFMDRLFGSLEGERYRPKRRLN